MNDAVYLDEQQRLAEALSEYEKAYAEYVSIFAEGVLSLDDYVRFPDILKKLCKMELVVYFTNLKNEAQEKAEWERWVYLKKKYGDK